MAPSTLHTSSSLTSRIAAVTLGKEIHTTTTTTTPTTTTNSSEDHPIKLHSCACPIPEEHQPIIRCDKEKETENYSHNDHNQTDESSNIYYKDMNNNNDDDDDDDEYEYNDDYDYDNDDSESMVEEISEMELLAMLDAQEDPLSVAQRLFQPTIKDILDSNYDPSLIRNVENGLIHFQILTKQQIEQLYNVGYVIIDDIISQDICKRIRQIAFDWKDKGKLKVASDIINPDDPFRDRDARSDMITW